MNRLELFARMVRTILGQSDRSWPVRISRPLYNLLLRAVYGRSGLERRLHGDESIRILPRYRSIGEDLEPAVYDALKRSVKIGYVVLDIGANVGIYTMLMARWVGKEGRVFAFEPAAEAREALAQHLALNSLGDRVELVASAISDEVGEASFFVDGVCGENGLHPGFTGHGRRSSAISVPVTTIDAFCSRTGVKPSVIKVDIEGFELHAIRGAQEVISRCRPVLIVELHQYAWKELGQRWAETREFFGKLGYLCSPLGANPLSDGLGHVLLQSKFNV